MSKKNNKKINIVLAILTFIGLVVSYGYLQSGILSSICLVVLIINVIKWYEKNF